MALLYHYISQLNIRTLLDQDCSAVFKQFLTIILVNTKSVILVIAIPTDELHWMTVTTNHTTTNK